MKISDILSLGNVLADVKAGNKRQLLQQLAEVAAGAVNADARMVTDLVWERENLGSTGYGSGTAFPHARIDGINKVVAVFARLAEPTEFDAVDGKPVDLVFLLISPENSGADHLTALAALSRLLKDPDVCEKLRHARSKEEIFAILNH
jgi:nitrogen PTS system EIIA component